MVQAADRRQPGATSTPPSLPAPGWRRDFSDHQVERLAPGTFSVEAAVAPGDRRAGDRPAAVMILAPVLGVGIWVGILVLLI